MNMLSTFSVFQLWNILKLCFNTHSVICTSCLSACHILECSEGLAQEVISTIGQAFELRFKQYLKNPPKLVTPHDRYIWILLCMWAQNKHMFVPYNVFMLL